MGEIIVRLIITTDAGQVFNMTALEIMARLRHYTGVDVLPRGELVTITAVVQHTADQSKLVDVVRVPEYQD